MAPHHVWIQCPTRARLWEVLTARISFGHDFVVQGRADPLRTRVWLIKPTGERIPLAIAPGEGEPTVTFTLDTPGRHTLLVEYDGKIWSIGRDGRHLRGSRADHPGVPVAKVVYYYQYAKAMVTVGDEDAWPGPTGVEFEIVPHPLRDGWIGLAVLYEGRPLEGAEVRAFCSGAEDAQVAITDAKGSVGFPFRGGSWLFITNYEDPTKSVPGEFDARVVTAVLTITEDNFGKGGSGL